MAINRFVKAHATDAFTLDLGCGKSPYAASFPNRVGFDLAPSSSVHVLGTALSLPFRAATFNRVLCTEVLEHVTEPHLLVAEIARVLKVGGKAIVTTRFCHPLHLEPHDYFRFTRYGLEYLFRDYSIEMVLEDCPPAGTAGIFIDDHVTRSRQPWLVSRSWRLLWKAYRLWHRRRIAVKPHSVRSDIPSGYLLVATKRA